MNAKKTILICDDDQFIVEVAKGILQLKGYEVQTLESCDFLVDKVTKMQPDLILMDLLIPPIGGDEATKFLKNDEKTKHIPVLVFSGVPEAEKIAAEIDAVGYIKKPFVPSELESTVENILSGTYQFRVKAGYTG